MWKARGWEVALPRCQLRGSKAEVDGKFMDSASCWLRWEKRLKELMKRKIEGAGEQGEGAKEGSREGSRGGIQQAEDGQSPSWEKRSLCVVQGVGRLAGWWQEAEEVWREAEASSESRGKEDRRLEGCLCSSPNTRAPLPSGP